MSSIFTKIIEGEIPSYKIYEDEHVVAFLDINPIQEGQVLVVPKKEVDYLFDLDEVVYDKLMHRVRYLSQILKAKLECARVCLMVEGYEVPHAHVKLIPTNQGEDLRPSHAHKVSAEALEAMRVKLTT